MENKTFIVPHDFTNVGENALSHALATAKNEEVKIHVLHVVKHEKDILDAEIKLSELIRSIETKTTLIPSVIVGNLSDTIGDFAELQNAELIFMGTHGTIGWQHITGNKALKIATHSDVPCIIVQGRGIRETGYDNIVVPLDLNNETNQKLINVAKIATYFKSHIHLITPFEGDEFLNKKVNDNVYFAKRFFTEKGIEVTASIAKKGSFEKEVVKYAVTVGADLITIMNMTRNSMLGAISSNEEQYIITNEAQIPVLIINPVDTPYGTSYLYR
jgi:nucleotide-binding universal stress UspA family protein